MDDWGTIGLIGFGAFGRLAAASIAPHARTLVHDPNVDDAAINSTGAEPADLPAAAACEAVVLAVPVQALPTVLDRIAPHVRPGAIVADVASVKLKPVGWMLERMPEHAHVVGTHPLFGPQTAKEHGTISGEPIALCRARIDDDAFSRVRSFVTHTLGLNAIELTPDEHDKQMALVQVITHLVGHAANAMDLPELPTATVAYQRLLQMKRNTRGDSEELFEAIQRLNPHAAGARDAFLQHMTEVARRAQG
ncbi:MAG: prephenate dehydrogenase/arogenate dehydrogenase family protein [Phycisphaerales bacterium]